MDLTCCLSTKEGAKVKMLKWHRYSHSVADGLSLTYSINANDVYTLGELQNTLLFFLLLPAEKFH